MESKKINQLATEMAPASSDLTIIGDPITGVSKKITWLQVSSLIGTAANLQQVTDNGATTTNPIAIGGLTITGLATGVLKSNSGVIASVPFGAANGVATLGGDGKVPSSQLPSYVDDVVEVANYAALPAIGETGKIYITLDNNKVYRWTGSIYVEIAANNAVWGAITGTLSNQTDLQNALNAKLSSVGLTMPTAFTVSNSPLTGTGGTIAVTGAGTTAQYIRGDGSLATFPSTSQEAKRLITEVYNSTGATLTKGTVVYINGGQGNLPTVTKANANADNTSAQTYGLVQTDITNNNNGFVVVIGSLMDLDTQAYPAGTQLYLSGTTAGAYTSTKPSAPIHLVYVGIVVRSHPTQGVIEVKIQNGYELDELHDVSISSVANGNILQYDSATSLWKNVAGTTTNIAEGTNLYYTDARSRAALSFAAGSGAYNSTTGVITIPTNNNQITNGAGYITSSALSNYVTLDTIQTISAVKTFSSRIVLNNALNLTFNQTVSIGSNALCLYADKASTTSSLILADGGTGFNATISFNNTSNKTYTLPSSTGTLALTSDIPSLSGYIQGSGTTNYVPKFTASGTIGNSLIYDTGTRIAIGGTSATYGVLTVQSDAGQFCIQSNTTPGKQLQIGYDHTSNNSYLSSLNQGVAFTPLALQPNGGFVGVGTATPSNLLTISSGNGTFVKFGDNGYLSHFNSGAYILGGAEFNSSGVWTARATSAAGIAVNEVNTGSIVFITNTSLTSGNSFSPSERMRITSAGNTQPGADNAYSLGVSGTRWSAVWAANGTIQTSDEREKKDIIDADLGLDFISKLRPVSFKWKVGQNIVTSEVVKDEEGNPILDEEGNEKTESVIVPREGKRTHYGLIAQEVEELLDGKDFGGFIHDEETDTKGLRYDQFIPLLIKSIQELEAKIVTLESKLN